MFALAVMLILSAVKAYAQSDTSGDSTHSAWEYSADSISDNTEVINDIGRLCSLLVKLSFVQIFMDAVIIGALVGSFVVERLAGA